MAQIRKHLKEGKFDVIEPALRKLDNDFTREEHSKLNEEIYS